MCPLCVTFVVLTHIWVPTIYVVNFVTSLLVCVEIYVGMLPHILAWSYKLIIFGNPHSVLCLNTILQYSTHQLGRIL